MICLPFGHNSIRQKQHNFLVRKNNAKDKNFGNKVCNLLRCKVCHADDLPSGKFLFFVELRSYSLQAPIKGRQIKMNYAEIEQAHWGRIYLETFGRYPIRKSFGVIPFLKCLMFHVMNIPELVFTEP